MTNSEISINLRPSLIRALVAILAGLLFIFASGFVINYLVTIIGICLIIMSAVGIANFFKQKTSSETPTTGQYPLIQNIATAIFGLVLVVTPSFFISVLMILLGIVILMAAVDQFVALYRIKKATGVAIRPVAYLVPSLLALTAIMILLNPFAFAEVIIVIMFGVTLLVYGITNIMGYILTNNKK